MSNRRISWIAVMTAALLAVLPVMTPMAFAAAAALGQTTADKVNVRLRPGGDYLFRLPKGTVCEVTDTVKKNGTVWYKVNATDPETKRRHTGLYIHGNYFRLLSDSETQQQESSVPQQSQQVAPGTAGRITRDEVNYRKGPSTRSQSQFKVSSGTIVEVLSAPSSGDQDPWYHVRYNGIDGYIQGPYLQLLSQTAVGSGYVRTTMDGVNLRVRPADSSLEQLKAKVVLPVTGAVVRKNGYDWVPVTAPSGKKGYVRSDCVTACSASGAADQSTSQSTAPTLQGYVRTTIGELNVRSKAAGANILGRVAKSGTELPYYSVQTVGKTTWYQVTTSVGSGYVSGSYVKVIGAQSSTGTTTPGAGTTTGNGAASVGTDDTTMVIYPVEKIDWFTGGIQDMIPKGENFKIYDVYTGTVWWAHRWSGGNHADIEPLTAEDTAKLCRMYGVSKASQITEKTHWQRRPCLVTVGKRTFACALYGVPHGTQTIKDNNYNGQCCLHFTNSRTHDTNRIISYTVEAIQYAYDHAPNGKK